MKLYKDANSYTFFLGDTKEVCSVEPKLLVKIIRENAHFRIKNESFFNEVKPKRARIAIADVIAVHGSNCHVCGNPIDLNASRQSGKPGWENGLHLDHVIPIASGGEDVFENIKPAHAKCNLSRRKKILK